MMCWIWHLFLLFCLAHETPNATQSPASVPPESRALCSLSESISVISTIGSHVTELKPDSYVRWCPDHQTWMTPLCSLSLTLSVLLPNASLNTLYFSDSSGESSRFCEIGALHDVMLYLGAVWMRGAYAGSLRAVWMMWSWVMWVLRMWLLIREPFIQNPSLSLFFLHCLLSWLYSKLFSMSIMTVSYQTIQYDSNDPRLSSWQIAGCQRSFMLALILLF